MNKAFRKVAAVGTALLAAPAARAQSNVTLYGVTDAGVVYKTGAGPQGGRSTSVVSGVESTNRWGIRGIEDLGSGIKATFTLENGFRINNGTGINGGQSTSTTVLFDRGATVGLSSERFGGLELGRNRSPFYESLVALDATGFVNFGSLNTVSYQNGSGYSGAQYYWVDNSVKYTSPKMAGFFGSVLYGFGGTPGNFLSKSVISARINYQVGIATLDGAYFHGRDLSGLTDNSVAQAYTAGVKVTLDSWQFAGNFTNFRNPSSNASQNFYTAEFAYKFAPDLTLSGAYIRLADQRNGDRNGSLYRIVVDYSLSKATGLYAAVGYVKNNSRGTLGILNSVPAGGPGQNQFAAAAGVRHVF
ncbi:porin [Trinickia sp. EG282A]|uniref:porin n=1 Tax=Trinickia sp. EG282A TaxID=3237013 RepID=UPI0034D21561